MAERKPCRGLNSKCFLTTYLMIVGFLLVLWMNRLPLLHEDNRDIPKNLTDYVESPPRPIGDFSLSTNNNLQLSPLWFNDKWTFVYFSHSHCLPLCQPVLDQMTAFQSAFATTDLQYLMIGVNAQHDSVDTLAEMLIDNDYHSISVATSTSQNTIDRLAKTFIALFLITNYTNGHYSIEQEQHLFLVDPKGRVFATFKPPFNHSKNTALFKQLRLFYGRSEQ